MRQVAHPGDRGVVVSANCSYSGFHNSLWIEECDHIVLTGNSIDHNATLLSLTGEPFNAKYLADSCNQTVEEAWAEAQAKKIGRAHV